MLGSKGDHEARSTAHWAPREGVADADLQSVFPTLANFTQKKLAFL